MEKITNDDLNFIKDGWLYNINSELFNSDILTCINNCTSPTGNTKKEKLESIFRAFSLFPMDKTRILILGQDPYPDNDKDRVNEYGKRAHGLAFSFANSEGKIEPADDSLLNIFKAIESYKISNKIKTTPIEDWNTNLEEWAKKYGVLLLNTALTYESKEKIKSHQEVWNPFVAHIICNLINNKLAQKDNKLAVFLWGKDAQNVFFQSFNKLDEDIKIRANIEHAILNKRVKNKIVIKKLNEVLKKDKEYKIFDKIELYRSNHPSQISENNRGKFVEYSPNHFKACDEFLKEPVWLNFPENNK